MTNCMLKKVNEIHISKRDAVSIQPGVIWANLFLFMDIILQDVNFFGKKKI